MRNKKDAASLFCNMIDFIGLGKFIIGSRDTVASVNGVLLEVYIFTL